MASQQWDSDWGDNNAQNSHPKDATYRRKSYEPFRFVNLWKRSKETGRQLFRQGKYKGKEVGERIEQWRRRA
ncbi:g3505 [Coccomyxa viridis]|uniref:G3505 protein n=1 Tax=Coccomyxa viridis TaxID=1274662 RepID=A0ABP1FMZ4_9CHLO